MNLRTVAVLALSCLASSASARPRVDLNGTWSFRTDGRGGPITVPGSWDAQGFGDEAPDVRSNYVGVGRYKRSVQVPRGWRDRGRIIMHLGPVHRSAKVWLNGREVHSQLGYVTYSEFDVTDAVDWSGANVIAIDVDSTQHVEVDGLAGCIDTYDFIKWGGIYGRCWLELRPEPSLTDLFVRAEEDCRVARVTARLHRGAGFEAGTELADGASRYSVRCTILRAGNRPAYTVTEPCPPGTEIDLRVPIRNAKLWSPDHPSLYDVALSLLLDGRVVDSVGVRTGFRRLEVRGNDIHLNGQRIFLRGYGDDACYPLTVSPPADKRFWLRRFRVAKAYGFNFVRHHSHVPVQEYFDAADEIGMLIQPELPIAYENHVHDATDAAKQLFRDQWRDIILQYRNHPSVAIWCMGNEAWNGHALAGDLYAAARQLDGSRPVCDTDGVPRAPYATGGTRETLDVHHVQFDEGTIPWGPTRGKYAIDAPPAKPVTVHEMGNFVAFYDTRDARRYTGLTKPSWLVGDRPGEPVVYPSHREEKARLWMVRQLGEPWLLEWRTGRIPPDAKSTVVFAFTAATGWRTEPSGGWFTLHIDGEPLLRFDLPEPLVAGASPPTVVGRSVADGASLLFDVKSDGIDQFGVMYLVLPADLIRGKDSLLLSVTGSDSASRRWFGLYDYTDTLSHEGRPALPPGLGDATFVNGFAELTRWVNAEGGSVAEVAARTSNTDLLPLFVANSRRVQALCRKLNTEAARREPEIDGYALWLLQDYWKGGQGLLNQFYEPKGVSAQDHLTRNSETVILLDRDRCTYTAGESIDGVVVVSHFGERALRPTGGIALEVLDARGRRVHSAALPCGVIRPGTVAEVADLSVLAPSCPRPGRYTLRLALTAGDRSCHNSWDYWVFPPPKPINGLRAVGLIGGEPYADVYPEARILTPVGPIPGDVGLLVAAGLTPDLVATVAAGRDLLLLSTTVFPGDRLRFKSPWWFPGPADSNLGTIIWDHPALGDFPHDGWCDLDWYDLIEGASAVHHRGPLARVKPIVQSIDLPHRQLTRSLLFEARVGDGRLLACSLDLTSDLVRADAAARWLLDSLLAYDLSEAFRPEATLAAADLLAAAPGLTATTQVEGFARIAAAAPDPHSGQTASQPMPEASYRGEAAPTWFARASDGSRFVTWETASVPDGLASESVTFIWSGVLGWKSEPEAGFTLLAADRPLLTFDVTDQPADWATEDGLAHLCFEPRLHHGADTLGIFRLTLPAARVTPGEPLRLTVRAGSGSMRWFGIHTYTDVLVLD